MVKIAHISDLHLLALSGATPLRLMNKRITGFLNLKLRRAHEHQAYALCAVAHALRERSDIDHLVITGDLTNLSLDSEFDAARAFLKDELALDPSRVSIIPGNHDAYTRGAYRSHRFERYFAEYISTELLNGSAIVDAPPFPFVRLRGEAAIIGLSSAVPRPPMMASGKIGRLQLLALHALLAHREVKSRTPVILVHHPWHAPPNPAKAALNGLEDADELLRVLDELPRGLLLHGHQHRRVHRTIATARGHIDAIGATSASLVHGDGNAISGFNVYRIDDTGLRSVAAFRLDDHGARFEAVAVPAG
jgi:3',5'-cyclic AMP phosphodiesterase CpdA